MSEKPQNVDQIIDATMALAPSERAAFVAETCAGDEQLQADVKARLDEKRAAASALTVADGPGSKTVDSASRGMGTVDTDNDRVAETTPPTGDGTSGGTAAGSLGQSRSIPNTQLDAISHLAATIDPAGAAAQAGGAGAKLRFGDYEVLDELGKGGMGVVYKARQLSADRLVALKLIRPDRLAGFLPDQRNEAVARFRNEVQATAKLEHDNVVTVYDVGEIDGTPYYAMRFVEGDSLIDRVRNGPLDPKEAADYTAQIADALAESHKHGILHRDLKPHNVMVDHKSERALLADFGLAKLTEAEQQLTATEAMFGSPPYMSPEQAQDASSVTEATDIYGLGATLYHLVTGRPPFSAANPLETVMQVINNEPPAPRLINDQVPRDLETIILKCLHKEPQRRYATARGLADELHRFIGGEPILARPISRPERVWRWCRRNPLTAGLLASTVLALVVALVATSIGLVNTAAAKRETEQQYQTTRGVIDEFFTKVSEDSLMNQPGMQPIRKELLNRALVHYQQFLENRGDDPALRSELGLANFRVGMVTEQLESAEAAIPFYEKALGYQEELVAQEGGSEATAQLADTWIGIGRAKHKQGKLDEAREAYEQGLKLRRMLAEHQPDDVEIARKLASSLMNLGLLQRDAGLLIDARELFQEAQQIRRDAIAKAEHPLPLRRDLARGYYNLANLSLAETKQGEAEQELTKANDAFDAVLADSPGDLGSQFELATSRRLLADIAKDPQRRMQLYEGAVDLMDRLAWANPDVDEYQAELARGSMNLGQLRARSGDFESARGPLRRARGLLDKLSRQAPKRRSHRQQLGTTLMSLAQIAMKDGDLAEAEALMTESVAAFGKLAENSDDPRASKQLQAAERILQGIQAKRAAETP